MWPVKPDKAQNTLTARGRQAYAAEQEEAHPLAKQGLVSFGSFEEHQKRYVASALALQSAPTYGICPCSAFV